MGIVGIELEDAVRMMTEHIKILNRTEMVAVLEARGRILAQDITAGFDQPPFPRSPLDGFAFDAISVNGASETYPVVLKVVETIYAGDFSKRIIGVGEAVRIMTGAPIPPGCNCVVRQEDVKITSGCIEVTGVLQPFENYCYAGEDYQKGTSLLTAGDRIGFVEMGILASAGLAHIPVFCRPQIGLFATGDELVMPGVPLLPGKIYNSNLYLLYGRLQELGAEVVYAELLKDDPAVAAGFLAKAAPKVDVIITTGGVSVGEKDIFHQILPLLKCERLFWRVNMKPGTPAMFSILGETPMLNLSGNPFAALTTFELLARPLLAKISGCRQTDLSRRRAKLENSFKKASKGRRFIRACYNGDTVRLPEVHQHASGILASMKGCNCLIDLKADSGSLEAGDLVEICLL